MKHHPLELPQRFWDKVQYSPGCWEWQAQIVRGGYGHFRMRDLNGTNRMWRVHRLTWSWANQRQVPPGLVVMHSCDNTRCCNPLHLSVGTHRDNAQDKSEKGRCQDYTGSKNPYSKLSEESVMEIRFEWESGDWTKRELGTRYRVTQANIHAVIIRKIWKHV